MYVPGDPRSKRVAASSAIRSTTDQQAPRFADEKYARLGASPPQVEGETGASWYTRGQNLMVASTEARAGAILERRAQPSPYVVLIPERDVQLNVSAGGERLTLPGHRIAVTSPCSSTVSVKTADTGPLPLQAAAP